MLVGEVGGERSAARRDTDHVGVDVTLGASRVTVPLDPGFELAVVVFDGALHVVDEAATIEPGRLAYLGTGRSELTLEARDPTRLLLFGGLPFESEITM